MDELTAAVARRSEIASAAAALRVPFPPEAIGSLPRAGTKLDYVGHAAVTDRLLAVDPAWTWEPVAFDQAGAPLVTERGRDSVLWIRLTVAGVTRLGVGIVKTDSFELEKQLISDAIRNAAMRFGVALDLWSKEDLSQSGSLGEHPRAEPAGTVGAPTVPATAPNRRAQIKARCVALQADRVSVADARAEWQLPKVDECDDRQLGLWEELLAELEGRLEAPFEAPFEAAK